MKLSQSLINNWVIKFNFHLWLNNRERSIKKLISFRIKKCAKGFQSWISFSTHIATSLVFCDFVSFFRTWNFISSRLFVTSFKWKLEDSHLNIISIVGSSNLNFFTFHFFCFSLHLLNCSFNWIFSVQLYPIFFFSTWYSVFCLSLNTKIISFLWTGVG